MNNIAKINLVIAIIFITCVTTTTTVVPANENVRNITQTSTAAIVANPKKTFKPYQMYIRHNQTCIRNKPNKNGKVIKKVNLGKKVTVTKVKGNWRRVGKDKWVYKTHLSKKDLTPKYEGVKLKYSEKYNITKNELTRSKGVVYYKGHKETWYSEKVLPGHGLRIPGRHVASDGTVRDKDGYICIAANYLGYHSRIMTSLGPGKVYDCGSMTGEWIDIYTNW